MSQHLNSHLAQARIADLHRRAHLARRGADDNGRASKRFSAGRLRVPR